MKKTLLVLLVLVAGFAYIGGSFAEGMAEEADLGWHCWDGEGMVINPAFCRNLPKVEEGGDVSGPHWVHLQGEKEFMESEYRRSSGLREYTD